MPSYPIDEIEGIGPAYGEKLKAAGFKTTDDFLAKCCDPVPGEELVGSRQAGERLEEQEGP